MSNTNNNNYNMGSNITPQQHQESNNELDESKKQIRFGIFVMMLGSSAGFLLYAKKSSSSSMLLRNIERIPSHNQLKIFQPQKHGPLTKQQYENLKPKW